MDAPHRADRFVALHLERLGVDRLRRRGAAAGRAPLATVAGDRVAEVCPRAAAAGVEAGDTVLRARGRCRGIRFAPADPAADARLLAAVVRLAARAGHAVAMEGPRTLVGAIPPGPGGEVRALVAAIGVASILGLGARPGIADGALPAALLARHARDRRDGGGAPWIAAPGRTAEAVGRLPTEALDLPGAVRDAAERAGLRTVGALAALGRIRVAGRYGLDVARRVDAAMARAAPEPGPRRGAEVVPLRPAPGVLGGGSLTAFAAEAPPGGSASALAVATRRVRGRPMLAALLAGTDDLSSVLVEALPGGDALLTWRPEPVRPLGGSRLPGGAFLWRGRAYAPGGGIVAAVDLGPAPAPVRGWRVPTAAGADLFLTPAGGGWACGGAFL